MASNSDDESKIVTYVLDSKNEANQAKRTRMDLNENNFEMYHLQHDFSHKKEGQSREILGKQSMAVEQIRSFFVQALVDIGDWWKVEFESGKENPAALIQPHEIFKLTNYLLEKAGYFSHVGNAIQSALLGSLAVTKVWGKEVPKPKYVSRKEGKGKDFKRKLIKEEDKTFRLQFDIVRQENYYPDPTGLNLYKIEESYVDYHEVKKLAKGKGAIYNTEAVANLRPYQAEDAIDAGKKARETGQDVTNRENRPTVKIWEMWGDIIDRQTGDVLHENVVVTIANERTIIRKPTGNPNWDQMDPYVVAPLIEVANSVWHRALMDAPTKHNRSLIELYNLTVDGAMRSIHGVNQIRTDVLEDASQISDGIPFGTTLKVTSALPMGAKVMEPVVTGDVPQDVLQVMNVMQQEFNSSALTSDLRQGVQPFRAVKATEVVEASNSLTSIFQGLGKNVEAKLVQRQLEKAWMVTAQNIDKISKEELQSLFGEERGEELSQLAPEDVFAETVGSLRFKVFGISLTLGKQNDFKKYMTMLQTIGSSEVLIEEFAKKYDFGKLLGQILTTLDIDEEKIAIDPEQGALIGGDSPLDDGAAAQGGDQFAAPGEEGADEQAQSLLDGEAPFPGSIATSGQ